MGTHIEGHQESIALYIVWLEHSMGKFSKASPEEVLREVQRIFPALKWRPSWFGVTDIWAQMRTYIKLKETSSLAFPKSITLFSWDRVYFDSKLGYAGWVPCHAREGDQICVFLGSRYPFVVRGCAEGFQLIGACYMHGIMEGEACELPNLEGDGDMMIALV